MLFCRGSLTTYIRNWCKRNMFLLITSKCRVVSYTRKVSKIWECRYFSSDFSFTSYISKVLSDAIRNLRFIIRTCHDFVNINAIKVLNDNAYFRIKLEYCSLIWFPIYNYQNQAVEGVHQHQIQSSWFFSLIEFIKLKASKVLCYIMVLN